MTAKMKLKGQMKFGCVNILYYGYVIIVFCLLVSYEKLLHRFKSNFHSKTEDGFWSYILLIKIFRKPQPVLDAFCMIFNKIFDYCTTGCVLPWGKYAFLGALVINVVVTMSH